MRPFSLFLLFFIGTPLLELYVLIEVGSQIGASWTILLSIFTAALGGWLVRTQGFAVLHRMQRQIQHHELPALALYEGVALLFIGFALLLPGFITDAIGFLLLITPIRRNLIAWILYQYGILGPGQSWQANTPSKSYLEGEYHREDE